MPEVSPLLSAAAGLAVGALVVWFWSRRRLSESLRRHERQLEHALTEARTDPLTGLWNRRAFDEQLALQAAVARRYDSGCAVVLIDIDELKAINDCFGHAFGDAALCRLAALLQSGSREADFAARFGGDEFAVLLPQTEARGALCVAFRFLTSLGEAETDGATKGAHGAAAVSSVLRASFGVAAILPDESATELLRRADHALYRAKQAGGNRIWWHNGREAEACAGER
jgi:diguanylate cyclase (GGDEF)-like protein